MILIIKSIAFAIPPTKNNVDDTTIAVKISGANAHTTQSGVVNIICGISNINIGNNKCNTTSKVIFSAGLLVLDFFL